jgi:hypothetical protein
MRVSDNKKSRANSKGELKRCSLCDDYLIGNEGFYCPKCKKGPLCKKHRLSGEKVCISCTIEMKLHEMNVLRGQEKSMKPFIRFLQFIFLLFSIFFVTSKFGILEEIEMLRNNILSENFIYIGIGTVILYGIFYAVLFQQRQKIIRLESEVGEIRHKAY